MRHKKRRLQLNRFTSWHEATLKSLARSLVIYQSIRTTLDKAKAVKPLADRVISLTKKNDLSSKREAFKILGDHKLVSLLFNEIAPLFASRSSGYTRIINLGMRRGDNAKMVILELTEKKIKEAKKPKKRKGENLKEQREDLTVKEKPGEEKKAGPQLAVKEKPPITEKPTKKFLGGLRNIFKKERDSL